MACSGTAGDQGQRVERGDGAADEHERQGGARRGSLAVAPGGQAGHPVKRCLGGPASAALFAARSTCVPAKRGAAGSDRAAIALPRHAQQPAMQPVMAPQASQPNPAPPARAPASPAHGRSAGAGGMSTPFAAMDVQQGAGVGVPRAARAPPLLPSRAATDGAAASMPSGDRWEFLSQLVAGPATVGQMRPGEAGRRCRVRACTGPPDIPYTAPRASALLAGAAHRLHACSLLLAAVRHGAPDPALHEGPLTPHAGVVLPCREGAVAAVAGH